MARTFGIELEVVGKRGQQVGLWGRVVQALTAAGFNPAQAGYMGSDYSRWQVKSDSSVNCGGYPGAEVVSPVLPADEGGFDQVRRVCSALEAANATANKTCGMHVHVDVRDLTVEQLKNVIRAYGHFQPEIDSVLPSSRRNCRWAAPVWNSWTRSAMLTRIESATTVNDLVYAIGTRYSVMNLQKYIRTGTLEFRQHSGTAEAQKAVAWARWCVAFVETYKDVNVLAQAAATAPAGNYAVMLDLPARGERRAPSRGISRSLVRAMANGPVSEGALESILRDAGNDETVEAWMRPLASRYGVAVQRVTVNGVTCWRLSQPAAAEQPVSAFAACFTPGGQLGYFGARRAALA